MPHSRTHDSMHSTRTHNVTTKRRAHFSFTWRPRVLPGIVAPDAPPGRAAKLGRNLPQAPGYKKACTCSTPSAFCASTAPTIASARPAAPPIGVALLPNESMQGLPVAAQWGQLEHMRKPYNDGSTTRVIT
eukprot:1233592-Pyramimonas_sp.AAC.1